MKIRNGFVSNSSSSSFCIVGATFGRNVDIEKYIDEKIVESDDYECPSEYLNELNLDYQPGTDYGLVVGVDITDMKMDETKREFLDRVEVKIREALPKYPKSKKLDMDIYYGESNDNW